MTGTTEQWTCDDTAALQKNEIDSTNRKRDPLQKSDAIGKIYPEDGGGRGAGRATAQALGIKTAAWAALRRLAPIFNGRAPMRHSNKSLSASKDEVVSSFKSLISGAEDLLRSTAHASGEGADTARRNFRAYVESARDTLHEVEGAARKSYRQASDSTHLFVRGNPWQAVGIAVAAGLLVGLFAGRRAD